MHTLTASASRTLPGSISRTPLLPVCDLLLGRQPRLCGREKAVYLPNYRAKGKFRSCQIVEPAHDIAAADAIAAHLG